MPGGRDSEVILVPGSILESAMLASWVHSHTHWLLVGGHFGSSVP